MIDLKFLRENPDLVKENIKKKLWGVILCIEYWLLKMRMTFRKY